MGVERCDRIVTLIDQALAGPDMESREGRYCWHCGACEHNGGPSGLCDACLSKLRDPALSIWTPPAGRTDAENPAILEGAYQHRPAASGPPSGSWWWRPT